MLMKNIVQAIYENGTFRPLHPGSVNVPNGQLVWITIENESNLEPLNLAAHVYEGLSNYDIDDIERIALNRRNFIGNWLI
jgi:predicted DNA-binding antitoxin AbrB/MazE fold protein